LFHLRNKGVKPSKQQPRKYVNSDHFPESGTLVAPTLAREVDDMSRISQRDLAHFKRQTCRVCKCKDKFNFHVADALWEKIVPGEFQNSVVCLSCFDEFARDRKIDYSDSLEVLYFAGDQATFKFQTVSAQSA
jgi:hypothetical protein